VWIRKKRTSIQNGVKVKMESGETGEIIKSLDEEHYLVLIDGSTQKVKFHYKYVKILSNVT
jgi:preprotein translocase subunit YajC